MDAKHFKRLLLRALTRDTAVRPVYDTLIIAKRILKPQLLDRMRNKHDGRVGGKPAHLDRVVAGIGLAAHMSAQEGQNRGARNRRVQGDAGEPPYRDFTARF